MDYDIKLNQLCKDLKLGTIMSPPETLSGGLLHKMFEVKTDKGHYVVKALNPHIMLRKTALQNYINSEMIALKASEYVPSLPAKRINNTFIHKVNTQYYIVFDWVKGISLEDKEIEGEHCQIIGKILGDLHSVDYSYLSLNNLVNEGVSLIDWKKYLDLSLNLNHEWVSLFKSNISDLYRWNEKAKKADSYLSEKVISHRDLDPKNVLWENKSPTLIDWEATGYINPYQELLELAIYWSKDKNESDEKEKFQLFIRSYLSKIGTVNVNWQTVLNKGYAGKLAWLEYNLKRALLIECSNKEEQELGQNEVLTTIKALKLYTNKIPQRLEWIEEVTYENIRNE